jgi:SAM-dependent methyltransferase
MAPSLFEYPIYLWQLLNGVRATYEALFAKLRGEDTRDYLSHVKSPEILDLGNGRLRPQFTILKRSGYRVYGIDLANRPKKCTKNLLYVIARYLYNQRSPVQTQAGARTLVCGDVANLPFKNEKFDLITSVAAFEHFLNVPAVISEMDRVLRPGGVAWILIHLFSCPSGGHNVTFTQFPLRSLPRGVAAWDHLRKRKLPFTVPLNEWRRDQYLQSFAERFDILKHYCAFREGTEFLSPEILTELPDYDADELTSNSYVVVARKRSIAELRR